MVLRIGGDSQDSVAPAGTPAHPGVSDLPAGFFSQLACLERENLKPVHPAGKRALIRRASFDLIGLPPTPEEVDAFLRDNSPEAFRKR